MLCQQKSIKLWELFSMHHNGLWYWGLTGGVVTFWLYSFWHGLPRQTRGTALRYLRQADDAVFGLNR